MGYPNHVKKTPQGLRYRVWSTITDTYISHEMTGKQLREFELKRQVGRAVKIIWQNMDRDIVKAMQVKKWYRDTQEFDPLTSEQYEKMLDREASQIGARIDVDILNQDDGSKVLTIKIKPAPKER